MKYYLGKYNDIRECEILKKTLTDFRIKDVINTKVIIIPHSDLYESKLKIRLLQIKIFLKDLFFKFKIDMPNLKYNFNSIIQDKLCPKWQDIVLNSKFQFETDGSYMLVTGNYKNLVTINKYFPLNTLKYDMRRNAEIELAYEVIKHYMPKARLQRLKTSFKS